MTKSMGDPVESGGKVGQPARSLHAGRTAISRPNSHSPNRPAIAGGRHATAEDQIAAVDLRR
jgi:hypothetical protein